ncbi:MAG: hypothetical protein NTY23_15425, partial [Chloroflexi bacterium]|nr:hypothetical protein [Chloroflexota bacterium]
MKTIATRLLVIAFILGTTLGASASAPQTAPLDAPNLKHYMVAAWGTDTVTEFGCYEWGNTGSTTTVTAALVLPDGSVIKELSLYYWGSFAGGNAEAQIVSLTQNPSWPPPVFTTIADATFANSTNQGPYGYGVASSGEL